MDATVGEQIDKLPIEGIGTVTEPKRVYPQGYMASQVLGLVGTDNVGLSGLEYSQDDALRGVRDDVDRSRDRNYKKSEADSGACKWHVAFTARIVRALTLTGLFCLTNGHFPVKQRAAFAHSWRDPFLLFAHLRFRT